MLRYVLLAVSVSVLRIAIAQANTLTVVNTNDIGPGSLYQAILDANANPGPDAIAFSIPGTGVQKIDIRRFGLPEITDAVTIDGYTQPATHPNTKAMGNDAIILVQIDGGADPYSSPENAFVISAGNCVIRGLSITGIPARVYLGGGDPALTPPPTGDSIMLKTNGGNLIEGNFIGVAPTGQAETDNYTYRGIDVLSDGNQIGGTAPASRNVISRNYSAIAARGMSTTIEGNYIGTNAQGNAPAGTYGGNGTGILATAANARIGGTAIGAGNLISASQIGITLFSGAIVQGNRIGPAIDGTRPLDSIFSAVQIAGSDNLIGGLEPGAANLIAYSIRGITVGNSSSSSSARRNSILSNQFFQEPYAAIDLGNNSPSRNDRGDGDTGPNGMQNYPVITRASWQSSGDVEIEGGLNSTPETDFIIQVYDGSGGAKLIKTLSTRTDSVGRAGFGFSYYYGSTPLPQSAFYTATATDSQGNTSEFAPRNGAVQLANISTRGYIATGDETLIGGFVIHQPRSFYGQYRKRVLIRALGPSLNVGGTPLTGSLPDPSLEVYDSTGTLVAKNDNWKSDQEKEISDTGAAPPHDLEAAVVLSLGDGSYTAQVRGAHGETGIGIVEVFDLDPLDPVNAPGSGRLVNISTRGHTGAADDVLIGGFIVNGDAGVALVIRALGPDLIGLGVPRAITDPHLELRDASGNLLAENDDWRDKQEREIRDTNLAPNDNRDSAILTTLIPSNYTAIVRSKNDTTGIALVEVYALGQ